MKYILVLSFTMVSLLSYAQSVTGQWETYDDETQEKKALIEIYEQDNRVYAKIVKSYISDGTAVCDNCSGAKKGKPIVGLVIIEGLKKDGDEYNDGTILDPENGKTYNCNLELESKNKLKVRGYLGISILGRTQYWKRKG